MAGGLHSWMFAVDVECDVNKQHAICVCINELLPQEKGCANVLIENSSVLDAEWFWD